jgi:hypothetical protein
MHVAEHAACIVGVNRTTYTLEVCIFGLLSAYEVRKHGSEWFESTSDPSREQADSETSIRHEVPYWSELKAWRFIHRSVAGNGEERYNDVYTLIKNTGRT